MTEGGFGRRWSAGRLKRFGKLSKLSLQITFCWSVGMRRQTRLTNLLRLGWCLS